MKWLSKLFKTKKHYVATFSEVKQLPMGMTEFNEWAANIIEAAQVPTTDQVSIRFVLAGAILGLPAGMAFKDDGYFINFLRRQAAQNVASEVLKECQTEDRKRKLEALAAAKLELDKVISLPTHDINTQSEVTSTAAPTQGSADGKVLGN